MSQELTDHCCVSAGCWLSVCGVCLWCCECDIFDPVSRLLFTLLAAPQQILSSWPDRNILYISNIGNLSNTHSTMNLSFSARPLYICPCTDPLLITIGTNVLGVRIVGVCPLPHLSQTTSVSSLLLSNTQGPGNIKISPFHTSLSV